MLVQRFGALLVALSAVTTLAFLFAGVGFLSQWCRALKATSPDVAQRAWVYLMFSGMCVVGILVAIGQGLTLLGH